MSKFNKNYCEARLNQKFSQFTYDFSLYDNTRTGKIQVHCEKHGWFTKSFGVLILDNNKYGCNQCHWDNFRLVRTKGWDDFVTKSNNTHKGYYQYPNQEYENRKSIVTIICPVHGEFRKRAQKHLSGQGCIECVYNGLIQSGQLPGGYCEQTFIDNPSLKTVKAKLYYLKINNGKYYKVGITTRTVQERIKGLRCKSKGYIKNVEILFEEEGSLYDCYLKEQKILKEFDYARTPRKWSTELFDSNILQR